MISVAALLALIGLTPGILALLGAPSIGGLVALSVADKVTLATTVIGLVPHDKKLLKKLIAQVRHGGAYSGHGRIVAQVNGGPSGYGRTPVRFVYHPEE